ncbi:MAG: hypothetical protein ACXVCP_06545 [Bdellovibrio sp.]
MRLLLSWVIIFNLVFSMPIAINAATANSSANINEPPTFEEQLKSMIPEKASGLVQRSILIAIEQVVSEKSLENIYSSVNNVYDRYGSYIVSPDKIEMFTRNTIDVMTKEIYMSSYQDILNRAHGIATGNLAKWSKESSASNPQYFNNEYKLYDLMIKDVRGLFKNLADPKFGKANAAVTMGFIRSSIVNKLNQASALKFKGENITTALVKTKARNTEKVIAGSKTSVVIDLSEDPYREHKFTTVDVEIPEIDLKEVFAQNPETLKYTLRKPLAGITHLGAQSVLFNIPLFLVTVAMVGLDSAKNPRALDQFIDSLQDPVVAMGFGLFALTNHRVAVGFSKIIKNRKLRFLAGPIGMAAGLLAQSVFTELWNDQNLRGCARSLYDPQPQNSESCGKFWNDWILTNKISQYTPAILSLLSTAFVSGLIQKYGGAALKSSAQAVTNAEAELANLMKQTLTEDPALSKAKDAVSKGLNKAAVSTQKIKDNQKIQELIRVAKLKLENAKAQAKLAQEFATRFKGYAADGLSSLAKGRLGIKISGMFAIAKEQFKTKADLEAYLLKLRKLKGFANFTLVSIGTNLVFLAIDPFISEPINEQMGKASLSEFNLNNFLDNNTTIDNFFEMIPTIFTHKIALPHEKDFKTIPDILEAYNTSLNYYLTNDFKGYDITQCYTAEAPKSPTSENDSKPSLLKSIQKPFKSATSWAEGTNDAIKRYLLNNGIYYLHPECVVKSDFKTWLDKYSDAEKSWRTLALSQVISSSIAWSETISNFVINYETTHDFYQYMAGLIYDYREKLNRTHAADLPEEKINREAILTKVKEISKIPLRDEWNQQDQVRYESLFPEEMGGFETPEYGDFMIASMACGPDPKQPISFYQNLKSLSWLPWESLSHLAPSIFSTWQTVKPNSPIIETYPGTSFKFMPPRITADSGKKCNSDLLVKKRPQEEKFKTLVEYIFKNAREDIITSQSIGDSFPDWYKENSTRQIYDENTGVWPVVKKNYENLMKYHFFPVLNDTSLRHACPGGGMTCGFTQDANIRPNGLIYSGVNELYTYIRTLRKILNKVAESTKNDQASGIKQFKVDFERLSQQFIYSIFNTKIQQDKNFDYNDSSTKLNELMSLYFEALPNTAEGTSAITTAALIFQKMNSVIGELEGYKKYAQLTFKKGEITEQQTVKSTENANDIRNKGHKK